jgi:hypothetical protein
MEQLHLLASSQVSTALALSQLSRVVTLLQLQRLVFTTRLDLTILHLIHNRTVSLEIKIFLIFILTLIYAEPAQSAAPPPRAQYKLMESQLAPPGWNDPPPVSNKVQVRRSF